MTKHKKSSPQVQKNSLANVQSIQLGKLVRSSKNVRNTNAYEFVDELSQDILRRGLLQPLVVEAQLDDNQEATGCYEVIAGGRRLKALQALLEKKLVSADLFVPCVIRQASTDVLAEDDSAAENIQRVSLHPIDQFHAFMRMKDKGMSEAEIAAAYFISERIVKQRIRLAQVAPEILAEYRENKLHLEQVMAFTITTDHERQLAVLDYIKTAPYSYLQTPKKIHDMLTETKVNISDARAVFVGEEAYKAAGGSITKDLFADEDDTYFDDAALLDKLFTEKLTAEAEKLKMAGWKWVEPVFEHYNSYRGEMRRITGTIPELTAEEQAEQQEAFDKRERLEAEYDMLDDYDENLDAQIEEIDRKLHAYEQRKPVYADEDKQKAGAYIYVDNNGTLKTDCGYITLEDEEIVDEPASTDNDQSTTEAVEDDGISEPIRKPEEDLSDKLTTNLTRHLTQAARNKLAQSPKTALTLLLCRLVQNIYSKYSPSSHHVLQLELTDSALGYGNEDLTASAYGQAINERYATWECKLQSLDDKQLWDTVHNWPDEERLALLAHCLSYGVNLVEGKAVAVPVTKIEPRHTQKNLLANALQLDMRKEGWTPQADNYFSMLKKSQILDIVANLKDDTTARHFSTFKKDAIARETARIASKTDWLPAILRTEPENDNSADTTIAAKDNIAEPVFLEAAE